MQLEMYLHKQWKSLNVFRVIKVDIKLSLAFLLMNLMHTILELRSPGSILSVHIIKKRIAGTL